MKIDGLALVRINGDLAIKEIAHDKDANTILMNSSVEKFEYFGIITYVVKSDEEDFIEIWSEELFRAG